MDCDLQMDNKCVEDFYEENGESLRYEEVVTSMEKPVATKHMGQSSPPLCSFSEMFVPIYCRRLRQQKISVMEILKDCDKYITTS